VADIRTSVQHDTEIDLKALVGGDKRSWDMFCARYAPTIHAAVRRAFGTGRPSQDDLLDAGQEVFLKLCRDDYKLLREFDPKRAKLATWIGIIAYSTTVDWLRRRKPTANIDDVPEAALAVDPVEREKLRIPDGLLSERQALVLKLIYDREMDVPEIAKLLNVEQQTVRSTHHKALIRLREHFNPAGG
jgi:RNA polymerase sigma factor (sigma-70 family)